MTTSSPPAWTRSGGMFLTPADIPFFLVKDGVVILCVCMGTVRYWWISFHPVIVQLRAVFCPLVQYLSFFWEAFSRMILDNNSFCVGNQSQSQWLSCDKEAFLQISGTCFLCFAVFWTTFLWSFEARVSTVATNAKWSQIRSFQAVSSMVCENPAADEADEEWVRISVIVLT